MWRRLFGGLRRRVYANAGEGIIARCPRFALDGAESEKRFECFEVIFCPASDFGGSVDVAEQPKKGYGKDGGKGMRNALFGAWIGNVAETFNEVDEGRGFVIVGLGHN